jgi:hypothetical protein
VAHIFVVSSSSYYTNSAPNPIVTIVGTVDTSPTGGSPVAFQLQVTLSSINDTYNAGFANGGGVVGGNTALKNWISPMMLAAAIASNPNYFGAAVPPTNLGAGTWTQ